MWNNVHIADLAKLYVLIFEKAVLERTQSRVSSDPYERFYWGSTRTHIWKDVANGIARILYEKNDGIVNSPEAESRPVEELPGATTTNSHTVSNRGFFNGWKPVEKSLEHTLEEDVDAVLAQLAKEQH